MKKILLGLLIISAISCKKSNDNRTCWDCTVTKRDGSTYNERVCDADGNPPKFTDNLGNDLNSICTKR